MNNIFEEIKEERERQDEKWGVQTHQPIVWSTILTEETGEVAKAALEELFDGYDVDISEYRKELIQTAAVAVAAIQCLDEGYADSHSRGVEVEKKKWKPTFGPHSEPMHSETGILYEVISTDGNIYRGYAMDWGFVPEDMPGGETTIEDNGEQIVFFREVDNE